MRRFIREIILSIIICSIILRVANYYHFGISITLAENADIATIKGLRGFFILGTIFRIVNFILKKLLHIVSWPLKFLTFGIISLVINIGVLYLFQRFVNHNYGDIATVQIAEDYLRAFILSIAITLSYWILSKILK